MKKLARQAKFECWQRETQLLEAQQCGIDSLLPPVVTAGMSMSVKVIGVGGLARQREMREEKKNTGSTKLKCGRLMDDCSRNITKWERGRDMMRQENIGSLETERIG